MAPSFADRTLGLWSIGFWAPLAPFLGLSIFVAWLFWLMARTCLIFLFRYRVCGSTLEAYAPLGGGVHSVQLNRLTRVRSYLIAGGRATAPAARAHALQDDTGGEVRLTEALPIWPEIESWCSSVSIDEMPGDPLRAKF